MAKLPTPKVSQNPSCVSSILLPLQVLILKHLGTGSTDGVTRANQEKQLAAKIPPPCSFERVCKMLTGKEMVFFRVEECATV